MLIFKHYSLDDALSKLDKGQYIWSKETESGGRVFLRGYLVDLIYIHGRDARLHEVIIEHRVIRFVADFDAKSNEISKEEFMKHVLSLQEFVNGPFELLDASRSEKHSVHIIFYEHYFANADELRAFVHRLPEIPYMDRAIYARKHSLRMAYKDSGRCPGHYLLPVRSNDTDMQVEHGMQAPSNDTDMQVEQMPSNATYMKVPPTRMDIQVFKRCLFHYTDQEFEFGGNKNEQSQGIHSLCSDPRVERAVRAWALENKYTIIGRITQRQNKFQVILGGVECAKQKKVHKNNKCYLNIRISSDVSSVYYARSTFWCPDDTCRSLMPKEWPGPDFTAEVFADSIRSSLQSFLAL